MHTTYNENAICYVLVLEMSRLLGTQSNIGHNFISKSTHAKFINLLIELMTFYNRIIPLLLHTTKLWTW